MRFAAHHRATWLGLALLAVMTAVQLALQPSAAGELAALTRDWLLLPRLVAGMAVGACLGMAGALMQWVTRNPIASPDLLGLKAGAQVGVIAGLLLPAAGGLPFVLAGGLAAALLTFAVAGGWRTAPLRLTLAGVGVAQCLGAALALFLSLNDQAAMVVSLWNTGSLQQLGWHGLIPAAIALPAGVLLLLVMARSLDVSVLGDAAMQGLGLPPARFKLATIVLASVLAAVAFQLAGPLGMIGLVTPNLLRLAFGMVRPTTMLPACALWGAGITIGADNLTLALAPYASMPLGVLSMLSGSLAVVALLAIGPRALGVAFTRPAQASGTRVLGLWHFTAIASAAMAMLLLLGLSPLSGDAIGLWRAWHAGDPLAATVFDIRAPRLVVDMLAGASLAIAGTLLQTITRNPLAGPEILGISQSAALAVLALLLFAPDLALSWRVPVAWLGAALALSLIFFLNLRHGLEPLRLVLTGFAITGAALGLVNLLLAQFTANVSMGLIWMVGSTYGRTWQDVVLLLPWLLAGLAASVLSARSQDVMRLGDTMAIGLGLPLARRRVALIALAGVLIAAPVAVAGPIGFVGLLVPHGVRLLGFHLAHERLIASALLGAVLLLAADVVTRHLLAPLDVPVGIATAALGAPFFLWLLRRNARPVTSSA